MYFDKVVAFQLGGHSVCVPFRTLVSLTEWWYSKRGKTRSEGSHPTPCSGEDQDFLPWDTRKVVIVNDCWYYTFIFLLFLLKTSSSFYISNVILSSTRLSTTTTRILCSSAATRWILSSSTARWWLLSTSVSNLCCNAHPFSLLTHAADLHHRQWCYNSQQRMMIRDAAWDGNEESPVSFLT